MGYLTIYKLLYHCEHYGPGAWRVLFVFLSAKGSMGKMEIQQKECKRFNGKNGNSTGKMYEEFKSGILTDQMVAVFPQNGH